MKLVATKMRTPINNGARYTYPCSIGVAAGFVHVAIALCPAYPVERRHSKRRTYKLGLYQFSAIVRSNQIVVVTFLDQNINHGSP